MDAAYEWACAQVGVAVHPRLLRDCASFPHNADTWNEGLSPEILILGGGRSAVGGRQPPICDPDVTAICLLLQSWAKTVMVPPLVHLDFSSEIITCQGARTIAAVLQVDCGLRVLSLRQTRISDSGAAALGATIGGSQLAELDLGECAISNSGVRLFARGLRKHGPPTMLTTLLLDGNPLNDDGIVDVISLIEGSRRPPALSALSVRPGPPHAMSLEVDAALRVTCDLCFIELREPPLGSHRGSSGSWGTATGRNTPSEGSNSLLACSTDMVPIPASPGAGPTGGTAAHQAWPPHGGMPAASIPRIGAEPIAHVPPVPGAPRPAKNSSSPENGNLHVHNRRAPAYAAVPTRTPARQTQAPPAPQMHPQSQPPPSPQPSQPPQPPALQQPSPPVQPPQHGTPVRQIQAPHAPSAQTQHAPHIPVRSPAASVQQSFQQSEPTPPQVTVPMLPQALHVTAFQHAVPQTPQASVQQPPMAEVSIGGSQPGLLTPSTRSSRHLAEWMAGTERELRELKWLFGASVARVDGQHTQLMQELDKLRNQIDVWADDSMDGTGGAGPGAVAAEEARLETLEARFDALEKLVGREQSECAHMWQIVEAAAAGVNAGGTGDASRISGTSATEPASSLPGARVISGGTT